MEAVQFSLKLVELATIAESHAHTLGTAGYLSKEKLGIDPAKFPIQLNHVQAPRGT